MSSAHTPSNSHSDSSEPESPTPEAEASPETEVEYSQVRVRRAPSVVAFMIVGPGDPSYSETSVFGVIAVIYGAVGVALGALVALWLDRRSLKKSVTARVEPESKEEDE